MSELNLDYLLKLAGHHVQPPSNDEGEKSPLTGMNAGTEDSMVVVFNNPNAANHFTSMCEDIDSFGDMMVSEDGMRFMIPRYLQDDVEKVMGEFTIEEDFYIEEAFDLHNGYHDVRKHEELGDHGEDFFPNGQTGTAPKKVGPSAAKHGNNPLSAKQFNEGTEEIHENLVYRYREFKKNQ